jgi:hypothetical protein
VGSPRPGPTGGQRRTDGPIPALINSDGIVRIDEASPAISVQNVSVTLSSFIHTRRGFLRATVGAAVASLTLVGVTSASAVAAPTKSAKGSTAWCAAHPKAQSKPVCAGAGGTGAGGTGSGSGASDPSMVVTASPNPVVETGPSLVMSVVQVEASPALAGDSVLVSSSQLAASCELVYFIAFRGQFDLNVILTLDDDGNATVELVGENCAPGSDVIEADIESSPYLTALTTLEVDPPVVTTTGLSGYPTPEVEVGDTNGVGNNDIGDSDVFAVFYIETSPAYAEQSVEISSAQLEAGCSTWNWISPNPGGLSEDGTGVNTRTLLPQAILDNDGNAVFGFFGSSCAAGTAQVIADVEAGTHPTYVTSYTIDPPAPTI